MPAPVPGRQNATAPSHGFPENTALPTPYACRTVSARSRRCERSSARVRHRDTVRREMCRPSRAERPVAFGEQWWLPPAPTTGGKRVRHGDHVRGLRGQGGHALVRLLGLRPFEERNDACRHGHAYRLWVTRLIARLVCGFHSSHEPHRVTKRRAARSRRRVVQGTLAHNVARGRRAPSFTTRTGLPALRRSVDAMASAAGLRLFALHCSPSAPLAHRTEMPC